MRSSFLDGWVAFDKLAHAASSLMLTMLIVVFLIRQFSKLGVSTHLPSKFLFLTAVFFIIALGVIWEFAELGANVLSLQFNVINLEHFDREYNDALKDLIADTGGALLGVVLSYFDHRK